MSKLKWPKAKYVSEIQRYVTAVKGSQYDVACMINIRGYELAAMHTIAKDMYNHYLTTVAVKALHSDADVQAYINSGGVKVASSQLKDDMEYIEVLQGWIETCWARLSPFAIRHQHGSIL